MKNLLRLSIVGMCLALSGICYIPVAYANSSETTSQMVSSSVITAKVKAALLGTRGLNSNDIKVTTVNDVVTLSGDVTDKTQIKLAKQVASDVDGVVKVENLLRVKPS